MNDILRKLRYKESFELLYLLSIDSPHYLTNRMEYVCWIWPFHFHSKPKALYFVTVALPR